ncbi:MAG: YjbF family lipoprotein [Sideroxyarcus sp.]|nr:YjbF family lipoprotein [Sideroxyarcus sp.]
MTFSLYRGCFLVLAACLAGCAVEPASQAVVDAYRLMRSEGVARQSAVELNPNFRYLRVQIDTREVFMVLGYVDQLPDGPVQVWYSAEADVLRLRDGRVVGATMKSGTDWLSVTFAHLPSWETVGSQAVFDRAVFDRVRDESPGYRYGIREKLLIRRIAPPDDSQLKLVPASSLTWFEETVQGGADILPARYAVGLDGAGAHQVIYAEQCLSSDYCFSWQSWPPSGRGSR